MGKVAWIQGDETGSSCLPHGHHSLLSESLDDGLDGVNGRPQKASRLGWKGLTEQRDQNENLGASACTEELRAWHGEALYQKYWQNGQYYWSYYQQLWYRVTGEG